MGSQMGAYGQLAGIGGQQMSLGGQQQAEQMARFDMMNRYGGQQRQLQQAALDIAKAEHEKAMQYPERQIGWMSQQLGALPYQNIVSEATYAPQQGPLSTTLGAVAGGQEAAADWRAGQPTQDRWGNLGAYDPSGARMPDPTIGLDTGPTYQTPGITPAPFDPTMGMAANTGIVPPSDIGITPTLGTPPPNYAGGAGSGTSFWGPKAGGGLIGGYQGGGYVPGIIGVGRGMGR